MRAQIIGILLLVAATASFVGPSLLAQEPPPADTPEGTLFFTAASKAKPNDLLCGEQRLYELNLTKPVAAGKAYVNRAVLEPKVCPTDFEYLVTSNFTLTGDSVVHFPLGCDFIGVIQNVQGLLDSVRVSLVKGTASLATVEINLNSLLCSTTNPYQITAQLDTDNKSFATGDKLIVRVEPRAVTTEPAILRYWYIGVGVANITAPGLAASAEPADTTEPSPSSSPSPSPSGSPSPSPSPSGSPSPSPSPSPNPSPSPTPSGTPPACQRDEPGAEEIMRTAGQSFTLRATCADPDNDMDSGDWRLDDDFVEREPLGNSPATVDHTFTIDEPGTHTVRFTPRDQADHEGTPARWTIHISSAGSPSPTPAETTPIPVFPSLPALSLGIAGALVGAFLVLRRRT